MTALSIKEAFTKVLASLAAAISILERTPRSKKAVASDTMFDISLNDYRKALEAGRSALDTLQPDGERREAIARAIARAICTAKGVNPDCLHQNYDDNEPIDHTDARGRTYHYGWRNQLHIADAAILASGIVQDEAGIRADEREKCAARVQDMKFPKPIKGCRYEHVCRHEIVSAIRSARTGGEG